MRVYIFTQYNITCSKAISKTPKTDSKICEKFFRDNIPHSDMYILYIYCVCLLGVYTVNYVPAGNMHFFCSVTQASHSLFFSMLLVLRLLVLAG